MESFPKLKKELQLHSLILLDLPSKTSELKCRGVSVSWMRTFANLCMKAQVDQSISTGDMVNLYIKPLLKGRTAKGGCSLFDAIPPRFTSPTPTHYIAHSWGAPFFELIVQIEHKFSDCLSQAASPTSVVSPDPTAMPFAYGSDRFIWIDLVAVPQINHVQDSFIPISTVKEIISYCSGGLVVVIDSELKLLTRSWCLLEIFYATYLLPPGGLQMVFPAHMNVNLAWELDQGANNVDIINRGECSVDRDKQLIVTEVKRQIGVKRTNDLLRESIKRVARSTLRWGSIESLAVYCALLIRGGEFSILHCTLGSLPDLAVDKDLLAEITGIFKVYDTDNSGELDEEEFITVLGIAGFSPSEAAKIFDEVNTDGGDGVSLEEFEEWWVSTQKQQWKANQAKQKETTSQSLIVLLAAFVSLLERTSGLESHAKFFKGWLDKMNDPEAATCLFANGKLIPPVINGDWKSVCDQVSWKLTNDETKGVCDLLWRFLLVNADACSLDVNDLAPKRDGEMRKRDLYLLLHDQLLQLTEVLSLHPSRWRQKDYFSRAAEEAKIKANCCDKDLPELTVKKKKMNTGAKNSTWFSFGLISDMVHLKYGEEQTISRRLIKEAGSALGKWMAANRQTQAGRSDVHDFSRNYLTQSESKNDEFGCGPSQGGLSSLGGGSIGKDTSPTISTKGGEGMSFSAMMGGGGGYRDRNESTPSPTRALRKGASFLPDIGGRSPSPAPNSVQESSASETSSRNTRKITSHAHGSIMRVHLPEVEQIKRAHSIVSPTGTRHHL